jgi:hypothetical protein
LRAAGSQLPGDCDRAVSGRAAADRKELTVRPHPVRAIRP